MGRNNIPQCVYANTYNRNPTHAKIYMHTIVVADDIKIYHGQHRSSVITLLPDTKRQKEKGPGFESVHGNYSLFRLGNYMVMVGGHLRIRYG